jgi:hypothetical protein
MLIVTNCFVKLAAGICCFAAPPASTLCGRFILIIIGSPSAPKPLTLFLLHEPSFKQAHWAE